MSVVPTRQSPSPHTKKPPPFTLQFANKADSYDAQIIESIKKNPKLKHIIVILLKIEILKHKHILLTQEIQKLKNQTKTLWMSIDSDNILRNIVR
jgi:hypothetical protein